ncbi:MAG: hypothetical protein ACXW5U_08520 [Thermoanaerobaculia bacterium]
MSVTRQSGWMGGTSFGSEKLRHVKDPKIAQAFRSAIRGDFSKTCRAQRQSHPRDLTPQELRKKAYGSVR